MSKEIECETCIKRKTMYCPNSSKCKCTENKPYYQNRIMLLEENEKLNHYKLLYQKVKDRNDKAIEKIDSFIECCKCEKLESGSDYLHHSYWDMFDNFNKQVREILKGNNE